MAVRKNSASAKSEDMDEINLDSQEQETPKAEQEVPVKPEPPSAKPKESSVDPQILKIIQDQKKIIEEQAQLLKELKSKADSAKLPGDTDATYAEIENDMLDEPKRYFAYTYSFSILGYTIGNKEVKAPYGTEIRFRPWQRYTTRTSAARGVEVISISMFETRSKMVVQFLENHPYFNVRFYAHLGTVKNAAKDHVGYAVDASARVRAMNDHDVIHASTERGLPRHDNLNEMRRVLTEAIVKDMEKSHQNKIEKMALRDLETHLQNDQNLVGPSKES